MTLIDRIQDTSRRASSAQRIGRRRVCRGRGPGYWLSPARSGPGSRTSKGASC